MLIVWLFYVQAYHRDVLEKMAPPTAITQLPSNLPVATNVIGGNPVRRRRPKKEKKSGSKRNRKVFAGNKAINISF